MISRRALFLGAVGMSLTISNAHAIYVPHDDEILHKKQTKGKITMLDRFFLNCNDGIPPLRVKKLVDTYGKNILIGIDPGEKDSPDEDSMLTVKSVKSVGANLHVYLVGPGMMSWSAGERKQIEYLAKSVKIDTNKSDWKKVWYSTGWKTKNLQQFEYYYKNHNAYSCEIDNIDSSTIGNDPDKTVAFYKDLEKQLKAKGIKTKLMIKNLNEDQLRAVIAAKFTTDFLCEFGMFEEGTGSPKQQIALCEKLGIKAITPISGITDTDHYGTVASGVEYNLAKKA
jgi:hypothetical protein